MRTLSLALLLSLLATSSVSAQTAEARFRWQKGQVLHYRVEHVTEVAETVNGNKVETKAKVDLIKRWEVVDVDAQGIAILRLSITAMRNEQTRPNGEVLLFDSRSLDKSTAELREQMAKFIGQPLALLRVDGQGKVIEVKQGVAGRYEAEPPFAFNLSASQLQVGQTWQRDYAITLDPPHGTGEKHPTQQSYRCTKIDANLATMTLATALVKTPPAKADQVSLLQKLPQGEVVFDIQNGRLHSTRLTIDREIFGHQGEGSVYRFRSTYSEQYAE